MTRLGVIVRANDAGLGSQTWEVWRHLEPDAALLVVDPHASRPDRHLDRFRDAHVVRLQRRQLEPAAAVGSFLEQIDVCWSAETFYDPTLVAQAQRRGVRLALHLNPELWQPTDPTNQADVYLTATDWRLDELAEQRPVTLLEHPVDTVRLSRNPSQLLDEPRLLHLPAPAMLDRNGTQALLAALPLCEEPFELLLHGPAEGPSERRGKVMVRWTDRICDDYADVYRLDAEALVLPRRYGGLSLPMQEAATAGLAVVTTDVEPQRRWFPPDLLIPVAAYEPRPMKAGMVPVAQPAPAAIAATLDRYVTAPRAVRAGWQDACRTWAQERSWARLLPRWQQVLRG